MHPYDHCYVSGRMSCHLGGTSAYPWHTSGEVLVPQWIRVNPRYWIEVTRVQALMHLTLTGVGVYDQTTGLNKLFRNPLSPGPNVLVPVITVVNPCPKDLTFLLAGAYE
ncbi:hypothetical protein PIB30_024464 [Stylosanthes scabra]|uniref:Uncharacterized protein n=1 Tax=Stylosanthes scabra TaxID=79078 RepID=A0ABU6XBM0_9FABA|nr:hypothetical protein [Stylosanthes scabra]